VRAAPRPPEPGEGLPVHLALFGAQAGFAVFPVFGKLALVSLPPLVLAGLRVGAAALLLEAFRRARSDPAPAPADRGTLLLLAVLGVSVNQMLFILGLALTTAVNTAVLTATIPVFTLAVAVLLRRERLTFRAAAGLVLAFAGALVLLDVGHFDWSSQFVRGDVLLLGNCLSYSFYLVLGRPVMERTAPSTAVAAVFLYGAPLILICAAPGLARFSPRSVTPLAWASLAAIVLVCSVIPYLLNSWALARTRASRVALYIFLQPLIGAAASVAVLSEALTTRTIGAAGLIFTGLGVTLWPGRP
jgi:drug/metabolite transporter (DMT)-like permease